MYENERLQFAPLVFRSYIFMLMLYRDIMLRRVNYGNETHVNVTISVMDDNRAALFVSLDKRNRCVILWINIIIRRVSAIIFGSSWLIIFKTKAHCLKWACLKEIFAPHPPKKKNKLRILLNKKKSYNLNFRHTNMSYMPL